MKVTECRGADARAVAEAVEVLKQGKIIIYPTDTVYALGCDALNARAVERLCRIKGLNPEKNLLSIVCADISQAAEYTRIDNRAFAVLKHNFPGPYTFILPAATKLPKVFRGRKSVGVRVPDNEFARALAESLGNPVMTSSVNTENIDAFEKLALEAKFQALSPGGAISYVEVPNMQNNLDAVLSVMRFIYDNIMYAELNTKSDYCQVCGFDGEILINDDGEWECPLCHNKDRRRMNVVRRTCGYLGEKFWNVGKTKEIKARVTHL